MGSCDQLTTMVTTRYSPQTPDILRSIFLVPPNTAHNLPHLKDQTLLAFVGDIHTGMATDDQKRETLICPIQYDVIFEASSSTESIDVSAEDFISRP